MSNWVSSPEMLVYGYVKARIDVYIPESISGIILLFYGDYDISFETNIECNKLELIKMICEQLNKNIKLKRIYSNTINDAHWKTFHKLCDNQGPTLTLIKNNLDYIFGGYTSVDFKTSIESWNYEKDSRAFLFKLYPDLKIYPIKSNDIHHAIYSQRTGFIVAFGTGKDLWVYSGLNCKLTGYSSPKTYQLNDGCQMVGGTAKYQTFDVVNIEVFKVLE